MWADLVVLGVSTALLAYWFRYTCRLILSVRNAHDYAAPVAQSNHLQYPETHRLLRELSAAGHLDLTRLDVLHRALDRDYRFLTCLIRHGAEFRAARRRFENRMLILDFHLMRARYTFWKRISAERGFAALEERAHILRHLAEAVGELSARRMAAAA